MNRILLRNALILDMETIEVYKGEVIVDNNIIEYVGPAAKRGGTFTRTINCEGNLLMPGFKNVHTHSAMTFLRSYADDLPLKEWLYDFVFPKEANLQKGDVYHLSKVAYLEYLTSGVTTIFDMYYFPDEIVQSSIDFGMRTVVCGTISKHSGSTKVLEKEYNEYNNKHELISLKLGFHAEYTIDEKMLMELSKLSNKLKEPVFCHISETQNEVEGCKQRHSGLTPPEYLDSLGLFNYGGGGFHCTYFTENDIEIFKNRNCYAVTCPGSNAKLASGMAPVLNIHNKGVNVAIGTDGPASNNSLDMFKEMQLVCYKQKLLHNDPSVMDAEEVLKFATVNGAKMLGLDQTMYLKEGYLADIIMIDLSKPSMQPINNIVKNIVYSGGKDIVKMTMINGRILYYDGKFNLNESLDVIYKNAQEVSERLKK